MAAIDYGRPLDGKTRTIETADGARLHTVSVGSGERSVLLAHGFCSGSDAWNLVAPLLAEHGLRVVAFDQRGHGQSTIGSAGVSTAQMASDYAAILDAYELTNTTLVGHSMGGFISIAFLVDGHAASVSRVGSLLLMGTFAGDVNRDNPQNRVQIPLIRSGILQRLLRFGPVGQGFTKSLIGDGYKPEMADAFIPTFMQAEHSRLIPILQAMVDESRYDRLNEITVPTTVLVGEKDKTTPAFHTEDLHRGITGSKLVRLPGVGHGPNWEAPHRIVEEINLLAGSQQAV